MVLIGLSAALPFAADTSGTPAEWTPREGKELLGTPAPAWNPKKLWLNSKPLSLEDLRGKVVLVRFWLVECPLCERTAPALNNLYKKYRKRGLEIIGFHHPKSRRSAGGISVDVFRKGAIISRESESRGRVEQRWMTAAGRASARLVDLDYVPVCELVLTPHALALELA